MFVIFRGTTGLKVVNFEKFPGGSAFSNATRPLASLSCERLPIVKSLMNLNFREVLGRVIEHLQIPPNPPTTSKMNRTHRSRVRVRRGVHNFEWRRRYSHLESIWWTCKTVHILRNLRSNFKSMLKCKLKSWYANIV